MNYPIDSQTVLAADLDGTLAPSKSAISLEMAQTLSIWLEEHRFAIISGGKYEQFLKQVVSQLSPDTHLEHLFLFPTNGAACYTFKNGAWTSLYEDMLREDEKHAISDAIEKAVTMSGIVIAKPDMVGEQIECRGGQVTFSAFGQLAPLEKKLPWDPDQEKRKKIVLHLSPLLPDFAISIGGTTSIDITRKGIDKAYAIERMKNLLQVDTDHIIFFGDALFEGGNDWPATRTGVSTVLVSGPEDTIQKVRQCLVLH